MHHGQKIMCSVRGIVPYIAVLFVFIIGWHFSSLYFNSILFPPPSKVFASLVHLLTHSQNYRHIFITSVRLLESITLVIALGTAMVVLAKLGKFADNIISGMIYPFLQAMPNLVWAFLVLLVFGLSDISPVFIVVMSVLPTFFVPLYEGFKDIDREIVEMAHSFTKNRLRIFSKIYFPLLFPYFFSGLRLSFAKSLKILLVAEFLVSINGIGYMLSMAKDSYNVERILAWTLIIVVAILFFDYVLFRHVERKIGGKRVS